MKTPDEIKKSLRMCKDDKCDMACPYITCGKCEEMLHADALAYSEQLEAERGENMNKNNRCQSSNNADDETIDLASLAMLLTAIGTALKELKDRAMPENRVLTPGEVVQSDGAVWLEEKRERLTAPPIPVLVYGEAADDCNSNTPCIALVNTNADMADYLVDDYNHNWRCWLRKPTEAERRGTPWAVDNRE